MKVFVTGATGFVGHHVARAAAGEGAAMLARVLNAVDVEINRARGAGRVSKMVIPPGCKMVAGEKARAFMVLLRASKPGLRAFESEGGEWMR
jgi:nucleoside-diphosphate-sugar epimerase